MVYTQAVRRGDIYYINNDRGQIGSEMKKDRPAVVVSNDMNNRYSNEITVVFLTSKPKKNLETHVTVYSTGRESVALCEGMHCWTKSFREDRQMYEAWENMKLLLMVSGGAILWIVMVLVAVGLVLAAAIIITLTVKELKAQHKRNRKGGHRNE